MKPGWKTTEFWITIATSILGLLAFTGVLTPDRSSELTKQLLPLIGVLVPAVVGAGYSVSRGTAKRNQKADG